MSRVDFGWEVIRMGFGRVLEVVLYGLWVVAVPALDASIKLCTG